MIKAFLKARIRLPIIVWGVFLFANSLYAFDVKKLASDDQWQNLLHYKQNFWGETFTRADTASFFMARDGDKNEEHEIKLAFENFTSKGRFKWICKFPARYQFFVNRGIIVPDFSWKKKCPKLDFFRDQLKAKSISMVFSSYYVNTPASAFGHTLLRFNKSSAEEDGSELLDRAINYSANVTTSNSFIYAMMGLVGGFYGEFAMLPYFYKLREYNDYESRDLWSYELNLTKPEISFLIDHLWEMKQTLISYYYLTENCSFYMLALLDVVNPSWKLVENSTTVILPGDTIKSLYEVDGLVKRVSFRPSLRKKLHARYNGLSKEEKIAFNNHNKIDELTSKQQARVLDTIIENQDLRHSYKVLTNEQKASEMKRSLLIKRSKLTESFEKIKIETPIEEAPHNAHGSTRIRMFYGHHQKWQSLYGLEIRHALHDKSDPPLGYSSNMEIDFGKTRVAFTGLDYSGEYRHRILFEGFDLVRVASHNPWTKFFKDFSWEFKAGIESLEQLGSTFKLSPGIDLSLGYYFEMGKFSTGLYWKTKAQTSSLFDKGYSFRTGPQIQLYYLTRKWSAAAKFEVLTFLPQEAQDLYWGSEAYLNFFLSRNFTIFTKWDWAKTDAFNVQRNRYWAGISMYY